MEHGLVLRAIEYINRQRQKKRWQKVVIAMAAVVVFCTTYALILPAITMERQVFCGFEAHTHGAECQGQQLICEIPEVEAHVHGDNCYQLEKTLICSMEESADHTHGVDCWQETSTLICTESTDIPEGGHIHDNSCYANVEIACGKDEHTHTDACYSNPDADVESASYWEKTFASVTLTGSYPADVLAIAETQLGYTESNANYIVNDDGRKQGYTRYGAWYGDPYGNWCAMFISFCLHYADVPVEEFPLEAGCQKWIENLIKRNLYQEEGAYIPKPGDLIFFNRDEEHDSDHVGIIKNVTLNESGSITKLETIEGNASNRVKTVTYLCPHSDIMGYGILPQGEPQQSSLSQEDLATVEEVIAMIDLLPTADEADEKLLALEEAEDWTGYEAYFTEVGQQGLKAYHAYTALSEEQKKLVTNLDKLMELEYIWSLVTLDETDSTLPAGVYGSYTLSYNETKDAFITDPFYSQFYNASSPLGTAGSFHIVAFDTAYLNVHTNGNVLAKNLYAPSNFGTNSKNGNNLVEISYAQNYIQVNHNSAADVDDYLVVGSGNTITTADNGYALAINDTKQDKPKNLIQDRDTDKAPFIDLVRVEAEIKKISENLSNYADSEDSIMTSETESGDLYLELTDPDNVGVYNLTATELAKIARNGNGWDMKGFRSGGNGAIVINVDCSDWDESETLKMPEARVWVDGEPVGLEETLDFSAGKVVWNLVNAEGLTIESNLMTGMIIAPESHIDLMYSFNGTAIGNSVKNHSETHRTDFNGRIVPQEGENIDGAHIHVYKVDKSNYGTFLQGAEFALYEWTGSSWVIAGQDSNEQISITDNKGQVLFRDLIYNVAYKLVETKAPPGYMVSEDPLFFFFENDDTNTYPVRKPNGFTASGEEDCFMHYYPNEASNVGQTSLRVDKNWVSQDGGDLPYIPWDSINFEVWVAEAPAVKDSGGNLTYGEDNTIVYGKPCEPELYGTYTLTEEDGWSKTVNKLPVTNQDLSVKYFYSIREVVPSGSGFTAEVTEDSDGSITITNKVNVETLYAPLAIHKEWLSVDSSVSDPPNGIDSVTFQLWRVSKKGSDGIWSDPELILDNISVGEANHWTWTSDGNTLLAQQTVGTETTYYAYYVIEADVPDGYYPGYGGISQAEPLEGKDGWTINATNTEIETLDLTVNKEWQDRSGEPMENVDVESITIQIQQSAEGSDTWTNYGEPITITNEEDWTYTVKDLPLRSSDGTNLTYRVMETPVDGFVITGEGEITGNTVTLTNRQVDTTSLTIRKEWKDGHGNPMDDHGQEAVQIQILQSEDGGSTWTDYGAPVTITAEAGWETTVTGLPLSDPYRENISYTYTVREDPIEDLFDSTVTIGEDGVITVTNQETIHTDITVEKQWFKNDIRYDWSSGSVDVNLYQILKGDGSQSGGTGEKVNVTVQVGQWDLNHMVFHQTTAVSVGTVVHVSYKVPAHDGDPALWINTMWDNNALMTPEITNDGTSRTFAYTYTVTEDTTFYGKLGHWDLNACSTSLSFAHPKPTGTLVGTATLEPGNGWRHIFRGLPKVALDEAGNTIGEYGYYVEEVGGEQYHVVYKTESGNLVSADAPVSGGKILVQNTITEDIFSLPETGGYGRSPLWYILGGLLLSAGALLLCRKQETGREGNTS